MTVKEIKDNSVIDNIIYILKEEKDFISYDKLQILYKKKYNDKLKIKDPRYLFLNKYKDKIDIKDTSEGSWNLKIINYSVNISENKKDEVFNKFEILKDNDEKYSLKKIIDIDNKYKDIESIGYAINKSNVNKNIFININEPFTCIITGIQGSGKSYTTNKIMENYIIQTKKKSNILIFHYDINKDVLCECLSLVSLTENSKILILTSPSNYFERKNTYLEKIKQLKLKNKNISIQPLLFNFKNLSINQIKILMNLKNNDSQLYIQCIMNILRKNNKKSNPSKYSINDLEKEIENELKLNDSQKLHLNQRFQLLKSFLIDCDENEDLINYYKLNDGNIFNENVFTIIDLTDDFLDKNDVNNIFRIMLDIFRSNKLETPKIIIFDEAHKYLSNNINFLNEEILNITRMQRHYGIRVIISTQNPCVLDKEIIELSNFLVLHKISSPRWLDYIKSSYKTNSIIDLDLLYEIDTGYGILCYNYKTIKIKVNNRITYDLGKSITFM